METASIIAIAVVVLSTFGTYCFFKYYVGQAGRTIEAHLSKDLMDLMTMLHKNAEAIGEMTTAIKLLAQGETVSDHEDRLQVLENSRRCGDCASFKAHA